MNKKTGQLRILAMTLVMSMACSILQTARAQDESGLTSEKALDLLQRDVGKWSGTRTGVAGAEDSSVTIVNRIEAGKWLYFQIAEKVDSEVSLSKGTLQFDPDSGDFVRRWFENGNAEIKQAKVEFNAEDDGYRYSMIVSVPQSDPAPLQLSDSDPDDASDESPENMRVTITSRFLDADTRLIETFFQEDLEDKSKGELKSKLLLSKVKNTRKNSMNKKPVVKKTNSGSSSKSVSNDTPKPAPVTHVLRVTVFVGSNRLEAGQNPDLTISPDEGVKVERTSSDTYEFTGLKPGEEYSVDGSYKLTTGFRYEVTGKTTPWKAPENQRQTTSSKNLRLEQ